MSHPCVVSFIPVMGDVAPSNKRKKKKRLGRCFQTRSSWTPVVLVLFCGPDVFGSCNLLLVSLLSPTTENSGADGQKSALRWFGGDFREGSGGIQRVAITWGFSCRGPHGPFCVPLIYPNAVPNPKNNARRLGETGWKTSSKHQGSLCSSKLNKRRLI